MAKLYVIFFLLIILNSLVVLAIEDPNITISLNKEQFVQKEKLTGNIELTFSDSVPNKELEVRFSTNQDITKLDQILTRLNKDYTISPGEKELAPLDQPEDSIFFPPFTQELGISVPTNAVGFFASGNIGGWEVDGSVPKFPYLDVGSDGLIEWSHLGEQIDWTPYRDSGDLTTQSGNFNIKLLNAPACEKFNIDTRAKSINVTAKYPDAHPVVNVTARFLSVPSTIGESFGTSKCILKKESSLDEWGKCVINFDTIPKVRQGNFLVCISAENETAISNYDPKNIQNSPNLLSISKDNTPTQKSYTCVFDEVAGSFNCDQNLNYNFFIKISLPVYNGTLDKTLTQFIEGETDVGLGWSLNEYLKKSCDKTKSSCIIPIEVGSQKTGRLYFNAFSINAQIPTGDSETILQKLRSTPDIISKIDSKTLSINGYTLSIPISSFYNFSLPETNESKIIPLEVRYGSSRMIEAVEVYPSVLTGEGDINSTINDILKLLEEFSDTETKDILSGFNINVDSLKSTFRTYQSTLDKTESNKSKTQDEIDSEKLTLLNQIENSKNSVPRFLYYGSKALNIPAIPPTNVDPSILGSTSQNLEDYILGLQSSIDIVSNAQAIYIKTFGNQTYDYTLIKRTVSGAPSDAYIVDIIPKSIVASSSELLLDSSIEVIKSDPIIKKKLSTGYGTFSYSIPEDKVDKITNINTLIVSTVNAPTDTTKRASYTDVQCGNNLCDIPLEDTNNCPEDCKPSRPWTIIIILLIFLVLGIFYINFYKGPGSIFNKIANLFFNKTDKQNLVNYIKRASKHKSKQEIANTLLSNGWSQEQIDNAFEEARKK